MKHMKEQKKNENGFATKTKQFFNSHFSKIFDIKEKFKILKQVGKGAHASALLAFSKKTKKKYILKLYNLKIFTKECHIQRFLVYIIF